MAEEKKTPVRLQLAWWELGVALAQLVIGSSLLFLIIHHKGQASWEPLMHTLAYAATLGQCLQLIGWLISKDANPVPLIGLVMFILVGLLDPFLVAAITLTLSLYGALNGAEAVARARSER